MPPWSRSWGPIEICCSAAVPLNASPRVPANSLNSLPCRSSCCKEATAQHSAQVVALRLKSSPRTAPVRPARELPPGNEEAPAVRSGRRVEDVVPAPGHRGSPAAPTCLSRPPSSLEGSAVCKRPPEVRRKLETPYSLINISLQGWCTAAMHWLELLPPGRPAPRGAPASGGARVRQWRTEAPGCGNGGRALL